MKKHNIRWLIPFIFLPGVLCTILDMPGASLSLIILSAISMPFCFILIYALSLDDEKSLWAWIILFVFIFGYYVQYYFLAIYIVSDDLTIFNNEMIWLNQDMLNDGLMWSCVGFWEYCVTAVVLLYCQKIIQYPKRNISIYLLRISKIKLIVLLVIVYSLSVVMSFIGLYFGFGQMGIEHNRLPLRLDSFVTHYNVTLVPIITLLLLWLTDNKEQKKYWQLTMMLFILFALLNAIIIMSRSALLAAGIPMLFLWILSGRLTRQRKFLLLIIGLSTIIFYPSISSLRGMRIEHGAINKEDIKNMFSFGEDFYLSFKFVVYKIATRISGIGGLIQNIHYGTPAFIDINRILWIFNNETISIYQTFEVVGIPYGVIDARVPGLLGTFALVGGIPGIIILVPLYTIIIWLCWNLLLNIKMSQVAIAVFSSFIFGYTSEGTLGITKPIACGIGILIGYMIFINISIRTGVMFKQS